MHVKECPLFRLNGIWEISSHQRRMLHENLQRFICLGSSYSTHCPFQSLWIWLNGGIWYIHYDPKTCTYQFQVDPAEDERSRYVQKIDSKWVFTHL